MLPFTHTVMRSAASAVERMAAADHGMFVAGGTDVLQLMQEGIAAPRELIDIAGLPLNLIAHDRHGLRIGALAHLADVAADERIAANFPALTQALRETASPQVRNMATLGGNLLQRTRCLYFRDVQTPCNKREPGSGCPAREIGSRMNAILGGSNACVATYPGDMAIALLALDASLQVLGPHGMRTLPVDDLHRLPLDAPAQDTTLLPGELITDILLPARAASKHSQFVKLRDRASFEWAFASAAIALEVVDGTVKQVRLAVGGLAAKPWRLTQAEGRLHGQTLTADLAREAAEAAIADVQPLPGNEFKASVLRRLVERTILAAGGVA
jgi:xanthine dehydrogenase YagS FAD-binding subunit